MSAAHGREQERVESTGLRLRFAHAFPGFALAVDIAVPARGVTALFGPSGSGKTTLLRLVAGLERAAAGRLTLNGQVWQDTAQGIFLPTHRRPIGVVFQDARLFPHLSVRGNLDFGRRRVATQRVALEQVVALLGIEHLLARMPDRLSGGEKQRVAIARALATSPRLLLLDEPLAALDPARKAEILPYLERLHEELDIPVLFVSHAPDEVARLADTLVLLEAGRVLACGPLAETFARADLPTARGDDAGAVIEATIGVQDDYYHLTRLDFAAGSLWVAHLPLPIGTPVRARILARDISLALRPAADSSILNMLPASIAGLAPDGPGRCLVALNLRGVRLLARITEKSAALLGLVPGRQVVAQIKGVAVLR